ncbi:MAG: hypothetical protein K2J20_04370 [Bacilli bacterium]|nr:hypothetical protein [Bacilli bacterium]
MGKINKRTAIKIFTDFATGAITTEEFWERFKSDEELRNILIKDKKRNRFIKWKTEDGSILYTRFDDSKCKINPDTLLEVININSLEHRYQLFVVINRFLISRKIRLIESELNNDVKEYLFLDKMLPDWVNIEDISLLQKLFSEAPVELSKSKKLAWCRSKIKEMFTYDDKPPEWYQGPEWPLINGVPLVFSHQETSEEGIERYIFYDRLTKEQVIVEQFE